MGNHPLNPMRKFHHHQSHGKPSPQPHEKISSAKLSASYCRKLLVIVCNLKSSTSINSVKAKSSFRISSSSSCFLLLSALNSRFNVPTPNELPPKSIDLVGVADYLPGELSGALLSGELRKNGVPSAKSPSTKFPVSESLHIPRPKFGSSLLDAF